MVLRAMCSHVASGAYDPQRQNFGTASGPYCGSDLLSLIAIDSGHHGCGSERFGLADCWSG